MQFKTAVLKFQASLCLLGAILSALFATDTDGWVRAGLFLLAGMCVSAFMSVLPKYVAASVALFIEQEQAKAQR